MTVLSNKNDIFNRCGLAALSDLQTPECREIFNLLEQEQAAFLEHEGRFRSSDYKWPRDPLHTWSRVWEYPYVFYHLKSRRKDFEKNLPLVVDLGSGVTFFPFSVARLGYEVICVDIDPICEKDLTKAVQCIQHEPGKVDFRLSDGMTLPLTNGEADIIYCVSVLEHIPTFEQTISEMARVLKPGGLLLLTIDLDLRGDSEIGVEKYGTLIKILRHYFKEYYPDCTIHPADILHSASGLFGFKPLHGITWLWFVLKQHIIKPVMGRKPAPMFPFHLGLHGFFMRKTEDI